MATSSGTVRAGRAFVEITADNSKFDKTLHETEARFRNWGSQMTQVAGQYLTGAAAFAAPIGVASKLFSEFDEALRTVAATTGRFYGDLTKENTHVAESFLKAERGTDAFNKQLAQSRVEMTRLTMLARQLGRDTSFTAKEAADAMVVMARAGLQVGEIQSSIKSALNLARATGNDAAETAMTIVGVLKAFRIEATETGKVVDLLGATVSNSPQNLSDLGSAMKYVGSVSRSLNISLKTTLEDLGTLAKFNIKGEQGGTALRNMYLRLTSAANQKKIKEAFNVSVVDESTGDFRKFSAILADVKKHVDAVGISSVEVATQFKEIFGMRSAPAALALMNADVTEMRDKLTDVNGLVQAMSDEMNFGLSGAIKLLISKFQDLQIAIIGAFSGPLGEFLGRLGKAINWVTDFIESHKTLVKNLALVVMYGGGAVAAFAGLSLSLGLAVKSASGLLGIMRKLSQASMGSITDGIKAIFGKQPKMKDPLEINIKSIDRARESTRYLNENVTLLSKATTIAIERFNRLSTSFERIANHAQGFKKATSIMADSNLQVTTTVKGFSDNYRRLTEYLRTARARINSTAGNLVNFKGRLEANIPSLTNFSKGLDLLTGAFNVVNTSVRSFSSSLTELITQSRYAINEVFYMNDIIREMPGLYKAAEKAVKKLDKTFNSLQKAASKFNSSLAGIQKLLGEINPEQSVKGFVSFAAVFRTAGGAVSYLNSQLGKFYSNISKIGKMKSDKFASIASIIKLAEAYNKLMGAGLSSQDFQTLAQSRIQQMFDLDEQEQLLRIKDLQDKIANRAKPKQQPKGGGGGNSSGVTVDDLLTRLDELRDKYNDIARDFKAVSQDLTIPVKTLYNAMKRISQVFSGVVDIGDQATASIENLQKSVGSFSRILEIVPSVARGFKVSMGDVMKDIVSLSETFQRIQRDLRNIGRAFTSISVKTLAGQLRPLGKSLDKVATSSEKIIQEEVSFTSAVNRMGEALGASAVGAQSFADALKSIALSIKTLSPNIGKFNKQAEKGLNNAKKSETSVSGKEQSQASGESKPEIDMTKYQGLRANKAYQMQFASRTRVQEQAGRIQSAETKLKAVQDKYEKNIVQRNSQIAAEKERFKDSLDFNETLRSLIQSLRRSQRELNMANREVTSAKNSISKFDKAVSQESLIRERSIAQLNLRIDKEQDLINSNNKDISSNNQLIDSLKASLKSVGKGTEQAKSISQKIEALEATNSQLNKNSADAAEAIKFYKNTAKLVEQGAVFEPTNQQGARYTFFKDSNGQSVSMQGYETLANILSRGAIPVLGSTTLPPPSPTPQTLGEQARERFENWEKQNPIVPQPQTAGKYESNILSLSDIKNDYDKAILKVERDLAKAMKAPPTAESVKIINDLISKKTSLIAEKNNWLAKPETEIGLYRRKSSMNYVRSGVSKIQQRDINNLQIARQDIEKRIQAISASPQGNTAQGSLLVRMLTNYTKTIDREVEKIASVSGEKYKGLTPLQKELSNIESWIQQIEGARKAGTLAQRQASRRQWIEKNINEDLLKIWNYRKNNSSLYNTFDYENPKRIEARQRLDLMRDKSLDFLKAHKNSPDDVFLKEWSKVEKEYSDTTGKIWNVDKTLSGLSTELFKDTDTYKKWSKAIDTIRSYPRKMVTPAIANELEKYYVQQKSISSLDPMFHVLFKDTFDYFKNKGSLNPEQQAINAIKSFAAKNGNNPKFNQGAYLPPSVMKKLLDSYRKGTLDLPQLKNTLKNTGQYYSFFTQGLKFGSQGIVSNPFAWGGDKGDDVFFDLSTGKITNKSLFDIFNQKSDPLIASLQQLVNTQTAKQEQTEYEKKSLSQAQTYLSQLTSMKTAIAGLPKEAFPIKQLESLTSMEKEVNNFVGTFTRRIEEHSFVGRAKKFGITSQDTLNELQNLPREFQKFVEFVKTPPNTNGIVSHKVIPKVAFFKKKGGSFDWQKAADLKARLDAGEYISELEDARGELRRQNITRFYQGKINEVDAILNQQGLATDRRSLLESVRSQIETEKAQFESILQNAPWTKSSSLQNRITNWQDFMRQVNPEKYKYRSSESQETTPTPVITPSGQRTRAERLVANATTLEAVLNTPGYRDLAVKYFVSSSDIEQSRQYHASALEKAESARDSLLGDRDAILDKLATAVKSNAKYNDVIYKRILNARAMDIESRVSQAIANAKNPSQQIQAWFQRARADKKLFNDAQWLSDYKTFFSDHADKTGSEVLDKDNYVSTAYFRKATLPMLTIGERRKGGKTSADDWWKPGQRERMEKQLLNEISRAEAEVAREQSAIMTPRELKPIFGTGGPLDAFMNAASKKDKKRSVKQLEKAFNQSFNMRFSAKESIDEKFTPTKEYLTEMFNASFTSQGKKIDFGGYKFKKKAFQKLFTQTQAVQNLEEQELNDLKAQLDKGLQGSGFGRISRFLAKRRLNKVADYAMKKHLDYIRKVEAEEAILDAKHIPLLSDAGLKISTRKAVRNQHQADVDKYQKQLDFTQKQLRKDPTNQTYKAQIKNLKSILIPLEKNVRDDDKYIAKWEKKLAQRTESFSQEHFQKTSPFGLMSGVYKDMYNDAMKSSAMLDKMKAGFQTTVNGKTVTVKGKRGAKMVFDKEMVEPAWKNSIESLRKASEEYSTAKGNFSSSKTALDKFNEEQKKFLDEKDSKRLEVKDQRKMISKLDKELSNKNLTEEERTSKEALRQTLLTKQQKSTQELDEMRLKTKLRESEGKKLQTANEVAEKQFAQATVNRTEAGKTASELYQAHYALTGGGKIAGKVKADARTELVQSFKELGGQLNSVLLKIPSSAKAAATGMGNVASMFNTIGARASASVLAMKTMTAGIRGLTFAAKTFGTFANSVVGMLKMQAVMAVVGFITTGLANAWNYYKATDEERAEKGKEESDQKNEKYKQTIDKIENKAESQKGAIQRLKELKEKDNLSEADQQEIEKIQEKLIQNGMSTETAQKLTETTSVYEDGKDDPVVKLKADQSFFDKTRDEVNEKAKKQNIANLKRFKSSEPWLFHTQKGDVGRLESDLNSVSEMFDAIRNTGEKLTDEEKEVVESAIKKLANSYQINTGDQNSGPSKAWTADNYAKLNLLRKKRDEILNQNGTNRRYDVGAQQEILNASKKELDDKRLKTTTSPEEVKNAYDDYISNLTTAIDNSRKAINESENTVEIQNAIRRMTQELMGTTEEYENYLGSLQDKLQESFPRFGADKDAYELVKSGASGSSALATAQEQELETIDKRYNARKQTEITEARQFYNQDGKLLTVDELIEEKNNKINNVDPKAQNAKQEIQRIENLYNKRISELKENSDNLAGTFDEQKKSIEEDYDNQKKEEEATVKEKYDSAQNVNRSEVQKVLLQKAGEQLAGVGGSYQQNLNNEMSVINKKDSYKGYWQYKAQEETFKEQMELQEELNKKPKDRDRKKIEELRKTIKEKQDAVMERYNEASEPINEILDRDKNTRLENTMLYYGDKNFTASLYKTQALKREKQKSSAINEIDYDIARYQQIVDNDQDEKKVQAALQQIQELNFFRQMAESFYEIEKRMAAIKEQFAYLEYGDKANFFGQIQTKTALDKEESEKLAQLEKETNEQYQRIESDESLTPEERMNEWSKLNSQSNQSREAIHNEYALKRNNQLANGAEDFTNPYETFNQQQTMQADSKIKKALAANGIDQRFVKFNDDGTLRALTEKESKALYKDYDKDIEQANKNIRKAEDDRVLAYIIGDPEAIDMAEKNVDQAYQDLDTAKQNRKDAENKNQNTKRIIEMANADATANVNSNYIDKMKDSQDTQLDYLEKAYYQPQNDESEMQLAMLESLRASGNPLAEKAYTLRSSQIRMGQAQMSLQQDQQKLAVLNNQTALARQNWEEAVNSGASEEVQQQLFKKYNQLLGEQQGVRQSMIGTFKEMAGIRGEFMKAAAATERASAGTFKAAEANRNSGDWQRENAIKQLNFLKQIATNTGMESDLL